MNRIQKYVKDRDEMLLKRDPEEIRRFVNEHTDFYSESYVRAINAAPVSILEIALHKMIVNAKKLPRAVRNESARWLLDHGYSGEIGRGI